MGHQPEEAFIISEARGKRMLELFMSHFSLGALLRLMGEIANERASQAWERGEHQSWKAWDEDTVLLVTALKLHEQSRENSLHSK